MAKKIRFPLEMEQGIEVRSLAELKENFSLSRVLAYMSNGKLVTWLRDRYVDEIADVIEGLDINDSRLAQKICDIFEVMYDERVALELERNEERNRRLEMLKEYTSEEIFLNAISNVAFTQDDLYDLLDEEKTTIYLCGDKFTIPVCKKGITYIGINNPKVSIDVNVIVDWNDKEIIIKGVRYDEKLKKILEQAVDTCGLMEEIKNFNNLSCYSRNSYLNFMLSVENKISAENCFNVLNKELNKINYNINADILDLKQKLIAEGLVGLANNFIDNL